MRRVVWLLLLVFFACNRPTDYTDPKNRDLCGYSYSEIRYAERAVERYLLNTRDGAIYATCLIADYDSNGICDYVISLHGYEFSSGDPTSDAEVTCMIALEAAAVVSSKTSWTSDKAVLCNAETKVCTMYAYTSDLRNCLRKYSRYQLNLVQYMGCIVNSIHFLIEPKD